MLHDFFSLHRRRPHINLDMDARSMAMKTVQVGTRAPDFDLPGTNLPNSERRQVTLADYEDRWLLLIFYPRDFSMI